MGTKGVNLVPSGMFFLWEVTSEGKKRSETKTMSSVPYTSKWAAAASAGAAAGSETVSEEVKPAFIIGECEIEKKKEKEKKISRAQKLIKF